MTLARSILQGALRFALISLLAYGMWAFTRLATAPLYGSITVVYFVLSGWLLHGLIGARSTLGRFYGVFTLAFLAYAALWCVGWFVIRGHAGEILGSAAGLTLFASCFRRAYPFEASLLLVVSVLFLFHTLGYTLGGYGYAHFRELGPKSLARLLWGLGHGLGFGAGIGYLLYQCRHGADS